MFNDEEHWPFKCPNCGNVIQGQVGDMKARNEITCPSCTLHFGTTPRHFYSHWRGPRRRSKSSRKTSNQAAKGLSAISCEPTPDL